MKINFGQFHYSTGESLWWPVCRVLFVMMAVAIAIGIGQIVGELLR